MEKLPENLIKLDQIRIERGIEKVCKCKHHRYLIDSTNRRITCQSCGAQIDPFEAMFELAKEWEKTNEHMEKVFEQKRALDNYKPHLRVIKELEQRTRTGPNKAYPLCPTCDEPFMVDELTRFYGAKFVTARILERIDQQRNESVEAKDLRVRAMQRVRQMDIESVKLFLEQNSN